ncbi:MAG: hypothetical protein ACI4O8_11115 [Aristaeellaceae bacterium]|nr:hypothetical protein [Eubacteriales bacterium]
MGRAENKSKYRKVSVWNWMGTLILCSIPGVNLIALILFIIFAKAQSKRSFAIAMLVLELLCAALIIAAFLVFPDQLAQFAADLRGGDAVLVMPQG